MTRPAAGKPRYRLRTWISGSGIQQWRCDHIVKFGRHSAIRLRGASCMTSAEAIRRAPR